jgi:hypothetical protein
MLDHFGRPNIPQFIPVKLLLFRLNHQIHQIPMKILARLHTPAAGNTQASKVPRVSLRVFCVRKWWKFKSIDWIFEFKRVLPWPWDQPKHTKDGIVLDLYTYFWVVHLGVNIPLMEHMGDGWESYHGVVVWTQWISTRRKLCWNEKMTTKNSFPQNVSRFYLPHFKQVFNRSLYILLPSGNLT